MWCNAYCAHLKHYSRLCGVMLIVLISNFIDSLCGVMFIVLISNIIADCVV